MSARAIRHDPEPPESVAQLSAELKKRLTEHHVRISAFASTLWQSGRHSAPVAAAAARMRAPTPSAHALMERLLQARSILTIHLAAAQRAEERYVLLAVNEMVAEVADGLEQMAGQAGHGHS
jgi:hypothetical protein